MSDHQAIFDAVRSRIRNGDIEAAVERALRDANISHYANMAAEAIRSAASQYERPSVLYRPDLTLDGDQYSVLYGNDLMDGCAGFGNTAAKAMADFDKNWQNQKAPTGVCEQCGGTGAVDTPYSGSDPVCSACDGTGLKTEREKP